MGSANVVPIKDTKSKNLFYQKIIDDLNAFEWMIENNVIEDRSDMIGAEQEICLVDNNMQPATTALEILESVNDTRFTTELALYNLELNLDPKRLQDKCFSEIEEDLIRSLQTLSKKTKSLRSNVLLTGILPSLKYRNLSFENMTPQPRFKSLSDKLRDLRKSSFDIYLQGVDDLILSLDSVLFEACNTSFQTHLQIAPKEFVNQYNWSQMVSGPVLSACTNSPMLFGRELWSETRIALFKQSLDTRSKNIHTRKIASRVYFGDSWVKKSPVELWKKDVIRFPLLLQSKTPIKSVDYKNGDISKLEAVRLHNGTTYTWNRLCYGVNNHIPHIRIECRYLPAGPSVIDEVANFAFWVGLMKGQPEELEYFYHKVDFRVAKENFIKAARTGINTCFNWFDKSITSQKLILDTLLPYAVNGLKKMNIDQRDIDLYLGTIEKRVVKNTTGSEWMIKNFRNLSRTTNFNKAIQILIQKTLKNQHENIPVHEWEDVSFKKSFIIERDTVEQYMNTKIFTVRDNTSVEMALEVMEWKNIHHLPLEDANSDIIGVLTYQSLEKHRQTPLLEVNCIENSNFLKIHPQDNISTAYNKMMIEKVDFALVFEKNVLCGIMTLKDLPFS